MRKKLIIFDYDGTLLDSLTHITTCVCQMVKQYGQPEVSPEDVRQLVGLGAKQVAQIVGPNLTDTEIDAWVKDYRALYMSSQEDNCHLFPGSVDLLEALHRAGVTMAVATGKGRHALEASLKHLKIAHYFKVTRTAAETANKPDPQMLLEILQEAGIAAANSVMIGDTAYDIDMGNNAQIDTVAVTYGAHTAEHLAKSRPVTSFAAIADLQSWLLDQIK